MKYKITPECIGCSLCVSECRVDAIHVNGQRYNIKEEVCNGCAECVEICPRGAIVKNSLLEVRHG